MVHAPHQTYTICCDVWWAVFSSCGIHATDRFKEVSKCLMIQISNMKLPKPPWPFGQANSEHDGAALRSRNTLALGPVLLLLLKND